MSAWFPWMLMVVASSCIYQLALKLGSTKLPVSAYLMVCGVIMLVSGLVFYMLQPTKIDLSSQSWRGLFLFVLVAIGTIGIDIGYFYMYKNNAPIALSRTLTGTLFTLATLLIGLLVFKEHLTINSPKHGHFSLNH